MASFFKAEGEKNLGFKGFGEQTRRCLGFCESYSKMADAFCWISMKCFAFSFF